ncbi:MAG TPA: NAD(P)/FAD-dependent oxidoreductase [Solirubrobacteraceae bacterium]|jgi:dihydrolipoamide dehydrogenase|nr:NAD(P)/FAD-dependent oxidoreductase [Solirubrobacteraceae bacterium]
MEKEFDVIVIGAGPAGEVMAGRLRDRGEKQVALVERELVGGECSFYACMPSKSLLRPAEALREARRVAGAAQAATGELDVQAVLDRRDEVIHNLDDSAQMPWIEERNIELVRGPARLEGERRVRVGDDVLLARDAIVLGVGSAALFPPIPGLAEADAWSNRQITTSRSVPPRLLVLGGGVVGVEMAQAWSSLGSKVTVIEAGDRLLAREEPFAGELVGDGLRAAGVEIHLGVKATEVRRSGEEVTATLESGESVTGTHLLVAIGRTPRTEGLGLESIGLPGKGYVEVDDHLRVADHPWLYAIGDVNGRSLLTHSGKYQARVAADVILGENAAAIWDTRGAPRVVFTDPQVAAVGLTLEQAQEQGRDVVSIDLDTEATAGGSFYGHGAEGQTRFVVDRSHDVLVGVTFVGPEMSDFLQAATIAIVGEVPVSRLAHAVAPFPTRSELWLQFVEAYERERGVSMHAEKPS